MLFSVQWLLIYILFYQQSDRRITSIVNQKKGWTLALITDQANNWYISHHYMSLYVTFCHHALFWKTNWALHITLIYLIEVWRPPTKLLYLTSCNQEHERPVQRWSVIMSLSSQHSARPGLIKSTAEWTVKYPEVYFSIFIIFSLVNLFFISSCMCAHRHD